MFLTKNNLYSSEDPAFHPLNVLASFFLIQSWVMVPLGPNAPAWTVSTFMFFYLVYQRWVLTNYRTRAIITRSRFETALDYKPRIFRL